MRNHIADKTYSEKYYNLDQIQYTLVLTSVSNKIHINPLYLLHTINLYRKHRNEQKV